MPRPETSPKVRVCVEVCIMTNLACLARGENRGWAWSQPRVSCCLDDCRVAAAAAQADDRQQQRMGGKGSAEVEENVPGGTCATGDEALVPLIPTGQQQGTEERERSGVAER